jgi:endo-1,4-beta-xylanase
VQSWVVVNQAMAANGKLRNSYWLQTIGPEYINLAFQWAHQADPNARLYYAENGLEQPGKKTDAVLKLLKNLKNKKIPVHGVELQLNLELGNVPMPKQLAERAQKYAQIGLDIRFAEVAVRINKPVTEEKLLKQGDKYQRLMTACLAVKRCKAFILWGFTDAYYMFPQLYPDQTDAFLFDKNYHPKPAYFGLYQALIAP